MPSFAAHDGTELFERRFVPEGQIRANLVLIHGYAEHSGRYERLGKELSAQGYAVYALDLRGHGRSGGRRGYAAAFGDFTGDVGVYLDRLRGEGIKGPFMLLSHSFGGLVSSHYVLEHPGEIEGLILSSPYFALALPVPKWEVVLGELCSSILPKVALPTGIRGEDVSHDPAVAHEYETDPLINKKATARWFTESNRAQDELFRRASEIKVPILMLQAAADRVAAPAQSKAVFERLGSADKKLHMYDGLFHEVFNESEPGRGQVVSDLSSWLSTHQR